MQNPDREKTTGDDETGPQETISRASPHDVVPSSGSLDLNRATEAEIAEIAMIGKKLARSIVEHRTAARGYQSWDALKQVPGLDAMKIAELQRAAHLGAPRA